MHQDILRSYFCSTIALLFFSLLSPCTAAADIQNTAKPKVAIIYTVTTPQLNVESALKDELGFGVELTTCEDASIFKEIAESGYVDRSPAAKYAATYLDQVKNGADAVLSVCSSVADIAYAMKDTA